MASNDERKPVTVLFADLAGSTELATRHDPERLRALLSAFFDEMRQQIEAYGGTVEKYAGDAIMAVFGVPHVHEDDAERAVRAAVAMRDSLEQLNPMFEEEYGVRLALRVGAATGEAVAASIEAREFLVTGEVPNLAARLQSLADGITVSEETHRQVASLVEAEATGPHVLKGFPQPVVAHRVLGLRAMEARPRGLPGLTSPVVGRDAEMAALLGSIEDLRRGRGQVVSIVGEAGIGKSRVKIEIREHLPEGVRWLEGRCQSYTQGTSYEPIIQIFRSALGLGATEAPAIARTKLRVGLRAVAGERGDQVLGAVARLLGVDVGAANRAAPADPRSLQSQLVLAARAILEGLTQRGPVVLAVEDLHWADTASVELLTLLLELTDLHSLMVLVTSRPETEGDAWTFEAAARRNYGHRLTDLRLGPLGAEDTRRLTENLLRASELPEAMRRRLLERAEGNPFFLEEIIRALIEQRVLRRDGERWVAAGDPDRWPIPTTLRGVLAARIDRLPAQTKAVLQRASVTGDDTLFTNAVAQAEAAGDDLALAFAADRRGQFLGRLGRWDEALRQIDRAAAIYARRGSRHQYALAINSGSRCWSSRAGKLVDALRHAAHFREIAAELGDARLRAWQAMEAEPYIYLGAWEDAARVAEQSLPVAWEIGEVSVILFGTAWLGLAYVKLGRLEEARRVVDRAIQHAGAGRMMTPFPLVYATIAAAVIRLTEGDLEAAVEAARRAVGFAEQSRFPMEQGAAHRVLGQTLAATGKQAEAGAAFLKSLEILEGIRALPEVGQTLLAYGRFKAAGDPVAGRPLVERARAIFTEIGADGWVAEAEAVLEAC